MRFFIFLEVEHGTGVLKKPMPDHIDSEAKAQRYYRHFRENAAEILEQNGIEPDDVIAMGIGREALQQ